MRVASGNMGQRSAAALLPHTWSLSVWHQVLPERDREAEFRVWAYRHQLVP